MAARIVFAPVQRLLIENGVSMPLQPSWADLRNLRKKVNGLQDRIKIAVELYPCDLLFIHRDAEKQLLSDRKNEVNSVFS